MNAAGSLREPPAGGGAAAGPGGPRLRGQHPGRELPPSASHPRARSLRHSAGCRVLGLSAWILHAWTRPWPAALVRSPSLTSLDSAGKPRRPLALWARWRLGWGRRNVTLGRGRLPPTAEAQCMWHRIQFVLGPVFSSSLGEKLPGAPAVHLQQRALRPAAGGVQLAEELQGCKQALPESGDWAARGLLLDGL